MLWRRVLPAEAMMAPLVQMAPALTATVALVEMEVVMAPVLTEVSRWQSLTETAAVMDLALTLTEASRRQSRGSELVVTGVRSRVGDSLWLEVVDAGAGD